MVANDTVLASGSRADGAGTPGPAFAAPEYGFAVILAGKDIRKSRLIVNAGPMPHKW